MRGFKTALISAALLTAVAGQGNAGVVDSADVTIGSNPYRTFIDQSTGLTWLDLDNFWDNVSTYNSVTALLAGSGFHLATLADLGLLQASIPAIPANFAAEAPIVGGNYLVNPRSPDNRELDWGIYEDGDSSDGVSYSWKYGSDDVWNFQSNVLAVTDILSDANSDNRDLGAWVVSDRVLAAPEPGSLAILGFALAGLGLARRKWTA